MSNHVFASLPKIDIPRSVFTRNHGIKTTLNPNYLVPIYVDEALPGDTFQVSQTLFGRLTTPICPIMDNLYLDTFYFAVPIRLIDDNWAKLMGERPFGDTESVYTAPTLTTPANGVSVMGLSDYLGIPPGVPGLEFNCHFHRAYNLIFNEWFRDENLVQPIPVAGKMYDGSTHTETINDYVLRKRGKRHDYFTSALPFPQKGDPVSIGIGGTAPVYGDGYSLMLTDGTNAYIPSAMDGISGSRSRFGLTSRTSFSNTPPSTTAPTSQTYNNGRFGVPTKEQLLSSTNPKSGLLADLGEASSVTINSLREAFAIQSLLETDARSGTRYIEIIRGHFGIVSPDARMQRPEYLGGTSQMLNVTSVPQTSSTNDVSPQGNLSAFVTGRNSVYWSKSFTEHCVILGIANIRADLNYQQGLPRMFSRKTRYDYYWPELANLGEQAILNKEIYAQGSRDAAADDDVFGYQERWAEYRYHPSYITGKFRSTASGTLDYWHLAQEFSSLPQLNAEFIQENVPVSRVLAVQNEPAFMLDGAFSVKCVRPMPLYSIPGIGRRF